MISRLRALVVSAWLALPFSVLAATLPPADKFRPAADAINGIGLELLAQGRSTPGNALLSPFSIQLAMAMAFAGADGSTREEMARILHFPAVAESIHPALAGLQHDLVKPDAPPTETPSPSANRFALRPTYALQVANRLFADRTQEFRPAFLDFARDTYGAPIALLDIVNDPEAARLQINDWVGEQTRQRIKDLLPTGAVDRNTRLVLVNALYLKAPWAEAFPVHNTQPRPFHRPNSPSVEVPTLFRKASFGYAQRAGYRVITIPYAAGNLQFVVVLPDATNGLASVEQKLTSADLAGFASLGRAELELYLPKLKLTPPARKLGDAFQKLGMRLAFDVPPQSANFDRMAVRKPDDYLFISEIYHKTFLELDESGTEAAAATGVLMARATSLPLNPPIPIVVRVDHPFLFAIQHRTSRACLFLGRVENPSAPAQ